jgi:hypothetical protein
MIAGIILVTGLLFLTSQYIEPASAGGGHGITIATLFNIPADRAFTGWTLADKALQFLVYDIDVWIVLLCASALLYWMADFAAEKLGSWAKTQPRPPLPQSTA